MSPQNSPSASVTTPSGPFYAGVPFAVGGSAQNVSTVYLCPARQGTDCGARVACAVSNGTWTGNVVAPSGVDRVRVYGGPTGGAPLAISNPINVVTRSSGGGSGGGSEAPISAITFSTRPVGSAMTQGAPIGNARQSGGNAGPFVWSLSNNSDLSINPQTGLVSVAYGRSLAAYAERHADFHRAVPGRGQQFQPEREPAGHRDQRDRADRRHLHRQQSGQDHPDRGF